MKQITTDVSLAGYVHAVLTWLRIEAIFDTLQAQAAQPGHDPLVLFNGAYHELVAMGREVRTAHAGEPGVVQVGDWLDHMDRLPQAVIDANTPMPVRYARWIAARVAIDAAITDLAQQASIEGFQVLWLKRVRENSARQRRHWERRVRKFVADGYGWPLSTGVWVVTLPHETWLTPLPASEPPPAGAQWQCALEPQRFARPVATSQG